jgi:hypothetical protein
MRISVRQVMLYVQQLIKKHYLKKQINPLT